MAVELTMQQFKEEINGKKLGFLGGNIGATKEQVDFLLTEWLNQDDLDAVYHSVCSGTVTFEYYYYLRIEGCSSSSYLKDAFIYKQGNYYVTVHKKSYAISSHIHYVYAVYRLEEV